MTTPQPKIVTWDDLLKTMLPYIQGYKWAMPALHDLWKLGAPTPDSTIYLEKRILLPNHFQKWWEDVAQKMGHAVETPEMFGRVRNS